MPDETTLFWLFCRNHAGFAEILSISSNLRFLNIWFVFMWKPPNNLTWNNKAMIFALEFSTNLVCFRWFWPNWDDSRRNFGRNSQHSSTLGWSLFQLYQCVGSDPTYSWGFSHGHKIKSIFLHRPCWQGRVEFYCGPFPRIETHSGNIAKLKTPCITWERIDHISINSCRFPYLNDRIHLTPYRLRLCAMSFARAPFTTNTAIFSYSS